MTEDLVQQLRAEINTLTGRVRDHDIALAEHERVSAKLDKVSEQLADLQLAVGLDEAKKKGYKPHQNPRWWSLGEQEKAAEVGRLRGWVEQIAEPWLVSAPLPACVFEHDAALILLDAASEAWRICWLPENRPEKLVAAQCEFLTRYWPALQAELFKATRGCDHQSGLAPLRAVAK